MAEDKSDELNEIATSQEYEHCEEISNGAADVSIRQSKRRGRQNEDIELQQTDGGKKDQQPDREKELLDTIEKGEYYEVQGKLTAKALLNYSNNPLLFAIKIVKKLHGRAKDKKPDEDDFVNLANRVEEFTLRFLDPLKYNENDRKYFFYHSETDVILDTAIKLEQKKFFDHPIIIDVLNDRWYGGDRYLKSSKLWWLLLNVWCLFDMVLFPLTFLLPLILDKGTRKDQEHKTYFTIPYFIFVRDTINYLTLLALHLAICVQPSQLSFSGLEWAILIFFIGRFLTEIKQILDDLPRKRSENGETRFVLLEALDVLKVNYLRDRWNVFDLSILIIFICAIFPLRITTLAVSGSVTNNRVLVIAGYLYGFNTMLLTFRAIGSILETFKGAGTIQIALFHIIRDAGVVVLHIAAITVAFASTITKVFVAENSMVKDDVTGKEPACKKTGTQCWWKIAIHLGWSLLDLSEGLDVLKSTDSLSETLAHLLFAAYLVLVLILLVNMLIALLSNTYQRVQDNSRNEWVFQKAITIQTYRTYHPIPVPFNIISIFAVWIYGFCKKKAEEKDKTDNISQVSQVDVKDLLDSYRLKYGDLFPPRDKLDQVLDDAEKTESMVNQILYRTFTYQKNRDKALLPTGPKAWETHKAILVDDYLITRQPYIDQSVVCGARYKTPFSKRFPYFEIMILEYGETKWLGLGVVFEDFGTIDYPGMSKETVGYHTDERFIYDSEGSKKTIGSIAARRGDVIRCSVLFEREKDGKVPVVFSVNGSRITPQNKNDSYIENGPLFPYIAFYYGNSVLAKMCASEDTDCEGQEIQSNFAEMKSKLECMQAKLDAVLAKLGDK